MRQPLSRLEALIVESEGATNVKDRICSEALQELVIARGSDGDDFVAREFCELDRKLTDSGAPPVDEDPGIFCGRRIKVLG